MNRVFAKQRYFWLTLLFVLGIGCTETTNRTAAGGASSGSKIGQQFAVGGKKGRPIGSPSGAPIGGAPVDRNPRPPSGGDPTTGGASNGPSDSEPRPVDVVSTWTVDQNGNPIEDPDARRIWINPDLTNLPGQNWDFVGGIYNTKTGESRLGVAENTRTAVHRYIENAYDTGWNDSDIVGFGFVVNKDGTYSVHIRNSFVSGQYNHDHSPDGYNDAMLLDPKLMRDAITAAVRDHNITLRPFTVPEGYGDSWKESNFGGDPHLENVYDTARDLAENPPKPMFPDPNYTRNRPPPPPVDPIFNSPSNGP